MEKTNAEIISQLAIQGCEVKVLNGRPFVIMNEGQSVSDLQYMLEKPLYKKFHHQVQDLSSFLALFEMHKTNKTNVYFDIQKHILSVIFDDNCSDDTGWRHQIVSFIPEKTRCFKEWIKHENQKFAQVEFAQFIERNLLDIVEPSSADILSVAHNLQAKKSVKFSSSLKLSNGSNEFTYQEDVRGTTRDGKLDVPETFKIGISIFEGTDPYQIEARLRFDIKDGELVIWYELVRLDDVVKDVTNTIVNEVEDKTGLTIIKAIL